jgi:hypothetical protein
MANPIQQFIQNAITWAFGGKDQFEAAYESRQKAMNPLIAYYDGVHRRPLKITGLGKDYNVLTNHTKTIVDRSVSMLVGAGVEFDLPGEGESEQDKIISLVWDANKKDVLLHDLVQFGSIYGTPAMKIVPNGKVALDGTVTDRLVALNPYNLSIFTASDDMENVQAYVYRWNDGDTAWREVTQKQDDGSWWVTVQKLDKSTGNKWEIVGKPINWEYDFPPIVHGKNLPNAGRVYGYSDIEGIIDLQDKYNEAQSNRNKILSLQAWAQKYIIGGKFPRTKDEQGNEFLDTGPDKALEITNAEAKVGILQPSGDLASSRDFTNDIRRDMFDIAATVDSETVKDKVGALTNFGLRVLFKNEIAKNATKQLLYGDLLLSVNNRLLQLAGFDGADANPGKVIFGDPLPSDDTEALTALKEEMAMGIRAKESAAKERKIDWDVEQERLAKEKQAAGNVGSSIIRNFLAGKE